MWSHYAQNHEGFCLEYDFNKIFTYSGNKDINKVGLSLLPVYYDDSIVNYTYDDLTNKLYQDNIFKTKNPLENKPYISSYVYKIAEAWKYEGEWRLIKKIEITDSHKREPISIIEPKAIYIGAKANEENSKKIIEIAKAKNIEVFKMKLKRNNYGLEAVQLL